jgi:hypothetical protein
VGVRVGPRGSWDGERISASYVMEFAMAFKVYDYNGRVDLPAPTEDAVPFEDGFREAFGELSYSE